MNRPISTAFLFAVLLEASPLSSAFSHTRIFGGHSRNIATIRLYETAQPQETPEAVSADSKDDDAYCAVDPERNFLFDRIGGEPALQAAVDELYKRLLADEKLTKYFEGVAMEKLKSHQYNFMYLAFSEIPEGCDVAEMLTRGHDRLWDMGLDETDFDAVAGHFVATLEHLGVGQEEIDEAVSVVVPLRGIFEKEHKKCS